MKTQSNLKLVPTVNVQSDCTSIITEITIPFKERDESPIFVAITKEDIFEEYKQFLIDALRERMKNCVAKLQNNLFNVISSNEKYIEFYEEVNGKKIMHLFVHDSYRIMEETIKLLRGNNYTSIGKWNYKQLLKAVATADKPEESEKVPFEVLLSLLIVNCQRN